jgi:hypothetical protein
VAKFLANEAFGKSLVTKEQFAPPEGMLFVDS